MKKVLLLLCLGLTLSTYSRTMVNSWVCDNIKIVMYDNMSCDVGDLTYQVKETNGKIYLHMGNKLMLFGNITPEGSLIMYNSDNTSDKRYFVSCD